MGRELEPAHLVRPGDDWYAGYASALAQIWTLHHDAGMIRHLLLASGITLKHLETAEVNKFDLEYIVQACRAAVLRG